MQTPQPSPVPTGNLIPLVTPMGGLPRLSPDAEEASEPSTTLTAMRREKLSFPLNDIWTERQWKALFSRCEISLYEVIQALGLIATNKECRIGNSIWMFDDPTLNALSIAISTISKEVAEDFREKAIVEDVIAAAGDSSYLSDQIDGLLERFGAAIWGIDAQVKEGCKVRLMYEEDHDRQLQVPFTSFLLFSRLGSLLSVPFILLSISTDPTE
jgi:hypothetical protein